MSRRASYLERRIKSLCGRALHGWDMIADGDRVAVGLSGGKDSLSLLWLLAERVRRIPIDYSLHAFHIEMGYHTVDHQALADFCRELGVPLQVVETDYGPRAHTPENREKSPCFFCALHRRRELFQLAHKNGCRKLALAHHQDDIHETFLMNLLFAGNLSTMLPVQPFFKGELVLIRPLSLVSAQQTRRFAELKGLPVQPPCCPSAGQGQRARVRRVLESFYHGNKKVRPSIWRAISHSGLPTLPRPPRRG
jgi:tRNA 2-thiocytidine biosynthesis protein TtcA